MPSYRERCKLRSKIKDAALRETRRLRRVEFFGREKSLTYRWRPQYPQYTSQDQDRFDEDTPINEVPLFNPQDDWYRNFAFRRPETWPPKHVHLCDKVVGTLVKAKVSGTELLANWPLDFVEQGIPVERLPSGQGYVVVRRDISFWALCFGDIVLLGDNGAYQYGAEARHLSHVQNAGALLHVPSAIEASAMLPSGCRVPDASWSCKPFYEGQSEVDVNTDEALQLHSAAQPRLNLNQTSTAKRRRTNEGEENGSTSLLKITSTSTGIKSICEGFADASDALEYDLGQRLGRDRLEKRHLHTMLRELDRQRRDTMIEKYPSLVRDPDLNKLDTQRERIQDAILARSGEVQCIHVSSKVQQGLRDIYGELKGHNWNEWKQQVADGETE